MPNHNIHQVFPYLRTRDASAKLTMEPREQFYGERSSKVVDPFGHEWLLGSHIEDVTPEEMQRRFHAMFERDGQES